MNEFLPVIFRKIPMLRSLSLNEIFQENNIVRIINHAITPGDKFPRRTFAYAPENKNVDNYLSMRKFTYLIVHDSKLFIDGDAILVMTKHNEIILGKGQLTKPNELFIGNINKSTGRILSISGLQYIGRILSTVRDMH
ncbi:MAG: hypothetical protein ACE3JK_02715 [Sporolactobacillus sp.]